jgi:sigma-B regulation protein RsbU (phosphoserine phosphatase)
MSVYIYSDGITEATNSPGELFSEQRLEAILRNAPVGRIDMIVNLIGEAVKRFIGDVPQSDDITAMAVRLVGRSML